LVLILPGSILSFLLFFLRTHPLRDAFLRSLVAFGVSLSLITEILGYFHLIRPWPLFLSWLLLSCAALAYVRRPRTARYAIRWFHWPILAGIGAVISLVALVAFLSPPNSTDAMGYHLPRVVYWSQAGSVSFFPTNYYPQLLLPPLAEYFMLQLYVLAASDHYVTFVQCLGFTGSIIGASLMAKALGAKAPGQVISALLCATIPNAILQASGVKNDCLLSLWLLAAVYFGWRWSRQQQHEDLILMGAALGLALLTKGTAYIFFPALLFRKPILSARPIFVIALCVAAINGPQYWRNSRFTGSIIGSLSAHADGEYRWVNDRFSPRVTVSNVLRNLSEHLGARSDTWNRRVYGFVLETHKLLGIDPNDRATTWPDTTYQPPVNSNHEANSPNRWHLALFVLAAFPIIVLGWRRRGAGLAWYYLAIVIAFGMFCSLLRWQPCLTRLHLPLFVLASVVVGCLAERLLPAALQIGLCIFLLNNARPYLFENWVRPLKGPNSVLRTSREANYFADLKWYVDPEEYRRAARLTIESKCKVVGVDNSQSELEYPLLALVQRADRGIRFVHVGVNNASARYARHPEPEPCVVVCLKCAGIPEKSRQYRWLGNPVAVGRSLLFIGERYRAGPAPRFNCSSQFSTTLNCAGVGAGSPALTIVNCWPSGETS
jgi:4-amino-4-deoxy-L-arabinose transferase-like glycosyltransferase